MTSDGQPYFRARFKSIVEEQVLLGYLTKGGVTYGDTEEMTPHERKIALDTIKELLEAQNKAQENSMKKAQGSQSKDPKTGLTSGVKV